MENKNKIFIIGTLPDDGAEVGLMMARILAEHPKCEVVLVKDEEELKLHKDVDRLFSRIIIDAKSYLPINEAKLVEELKPWPEPHKSSKRRRRF